ncbi:hypothetical protein Leryth_007256 [Lithospermum erythrorhizon]|nr:hypothetical protein Leryth_007256 [Lithospermum erythrorhizon]
MEGIPNPLPRTVEEVFDDFKGRRAGLIKALTTGSFSNAILEVPPELPEPALGINFARDGMQEKDLSLGTLHVQLMINDLPTVFEVVSGTIKQPKEQNSTHNNSKHKSSNKTPAKVSAPKEEDESGKEEEDEDDQGGTLCGACRG